MEIGDIRPNGRGCQRLRGFGGPRDVAGRQANHNGCREDSGPARAGVRFAGCPRFIEGAPDRRDGGVDAPLREADECKPRLRIEPEAACLAIGVLGPAQVAQHAQQLTMLVGRHSPGGLRGIRQPVTCPFRLFQGLRPRAVERLDLGPVDQALAPERDEVGLRS